MAQQPLRECSASTADPAQQLVPPLPGVIASGFQALRTSPEAEAERDVETGDSRCRQPASIIEATVANPVGREPSETGYHGTAEAAISSDQVTESYKTES